jgi:Spy/CpxP family protein refolding chaperone
MFASPLDVAHRLAETLSLTDEQRTKYDALIEKFRPRFDEQAKQSEKAQELMRQRRDAQQSGDDAKVEEIRQQMEEMRAASQPLLNDFFKEVKTLLTPEQVVKLDDFRDRMERVRGGAGGIEQLIQRLPEGLQLTDEQRAKYEKLTTEFRAQQQELLPLVQEMRKARQEGNEARATELEKQIRDKRDDGGAGKFLDQVEPILTDEQKAKLPELWAKYTGGGPEDVRTVLQAALRLELNADQQKRLREIARDAMRASRGEATPEKRAEQFKTTKSQVVALLDAKQAAELERLLESRQRPDRGARRAPGEGPGQPPPGRP